MKMKFIYLMRQLNEGFGIFEDVGKRWENNQLLWVNRRKKKRAVAHVLSVKFENASKGWLSDFERPILEKNLKFYRFCFIISINTDRGGKVEKGSDDRFLSSPKNIIVTVFNKMRLFFNEFKKEILRKKAETHQRSGRSFVASLLDNHIISYFRAIENIDKKVDKLDNKILTNLKALSIFK